MGIEQNGQSQHEPSIESHDRGFFGNRANPEARFISDHQRLEEYVDACRTIGLKIVLTSGSFDMIHVGHARYLEKAKEYGDVLIVGVDSDAKVKQRKGNDRPVVPENERVQMLSHMRSVDLITLKYPDEPKWELITRLHPDTLIVTQETYTNEILLELEGLCERVICLEPQATTSTSAQIRRLQTGWSGAIVEPIDELLNTYEAPEELRRAIGKILIGRGDG